MDGWMNKISLLFVLPFYMFMLMFIIYKIKNNKGEHKN